MGIRNFKLLIDTVTKVPRSSSEDGGRDSAAAEGGGDVPRFDSILLDVQSMIYTAIDHVFVPAAAANDEIEFVRRISVDVESQIANVLRYIFSTRTIARDGDETVVVCSFDGESVPMKWPTQRNRRRDADLSGKNLYRIALFGNNSISVRVRDHFVSELSSCRFHDSHFHRLRKGDVPKRTRYIVSGCDSEGEGEHKMFHIAEKLRGIEPRTCRRPVVVSVDNDVFVLALARSSRYENVQVCKGNGKSFYDLGRLRSRRAMPFPVESMVRASLLFGNDFIPPVVHITPNSCHAILDALARIRGGEGAAEAKDDRTTKTTTDDGDESSDLPLFYAAFLREMSPSMKYRATPALRRDLVVRFWTTCLWVLDYYTRNDDFPQKYMSNDLFDDFDRNAILTALLDRETSCELFREARERYRDPQQLAPPPTGSAVSVVFEDPDAYEKVRRFLVPERAERRRTDTGCHDITISLLTRTRKRTIGAGSVRGPTGESGSRRISLLEPVDISSVCPISRGSSRVRVPKSSLNDDRTRGRSSASPRRSESTRRTIGRGESDRRRFPSRSASDPSGTVP